MTCFWFFSAGVLGYDYDHYVLSDSILHRHDDVVHSACGETYIKRKAITLNHLKPTPCTIRITHTSTGSGDPQYAALTIIYKNGAPFGPLHINDTSSPMTFVDNLEFANGDHVELWHRSGVAIATTHPLKWFRLLGTLEPPQPIAENTF